MNNYESRLYAIAVRAPISALHIKKVEHPLVIQLDERLQEAYNLLARVRKLSLEKKYSKIPFSRVGGEFGIIRVGADFDYYGLPYFRLEVSVDRACDVSRKESNSFIKALAALEYAKNTIDTPQEQVVMCLPVDEDVCKAILDMPTLEKNISDYLSTPFDKEGTLVAVTEFLASIEQYEYRECSDNELPTDKYNLYEQVHKSLKNGKQRSTIPFVVFGVVGTILLVLLISLI